MPRAFPEFGYNPVTGEWNDSLKADYCWSNINFGEAAPDVMTPSTWSLLWVYLNVTFPVNVPGGHLAGGNICGRLYFNLSVISSLYHLIGLDARREKFGDLLGSLPAGLEIPYLPFSTSSALWHVLPGIIQDHVLTSRDHRQFPRYLSNLPGWCRAMRARIQQCEHAAELLALWNKSIWPARLHDFRVLRSMTISLSQPATRLNYDLTALAGETEAGPLLSSLSGSFGDLVSLGPLLGLAKVKDGRMSRAEYMEQYGHRGPHEVELSAPRPDEDPDWLDKRLAEFDQPAVDVEALLAKQRAGCSAAWQRFEAKFPDQYETFRRRLAQVATAANNREAIRSESIRMSGVIRQFLLRAARVTGIGGGASHEAAMNGSDCNDIFFLTRDEMTALLSGDRQALSRVPARREMYQRCRALPPYPAIIYGRFDPFQWAADPHRRMDVFDARQAGAPVTLSQTIQGFGGSVGCVEGTVRRIDRVEDGHQLQRGEILVTSTTNIGWTPLFPRLAAIVTDVGAPLSHAAIVAREIGIPAVVGCGNATMLLKTGDRVRVDGGRGTVEMIQ